MKKPISSTEVEISGRKPKWVRLSRIVFVGFGFVCFLLLLLESRVTAEETFVVIAHRGASGYLPEHTLEAKALAYGQGADYLEQDCVLTRDDIPIVLHDVHLDTISNVAKLFPDRAREDGRFYAIDFDLSEIRQLSVSERFHPESGEAYYPNRFPPHTGNFRIPTLEEEIVFIQGLNKSTGKEVGIYPEIKQPDFHHQEGKDISSRMLDILGKLGYRNKNDACYLQCFDAKENQRVRHELGCQLKMVQLLADEPWLKPEATKEEINRELKQIASYADAIGPNLSSLFRKDESGKVIGARVVEVAHDVGLLLHPWTIRADDISEPFESFEALHHGLLKAGIDGAFSDFPDQTLRLVR